MRSSTNSPERVVSVGVPVPGLGLLSYRVPSGMRPPAKGARASVPLGSRTVLGCVVDPDATPPPGAKLRDLLQVLDAEPFLPSVVVDLALWIGEYYAAGAGAALALAMPPASRTGRASAFRTERIAEVAPDPPPGIAPKGARQQQALDLIRAASGGVALSTLRARHIGAASLGSLVKLGLIAFRDRVVDRDPFRSADGSEKDSQWALAAPAHADRELTPEQAGVLQALEADSITGDARTVLLHGVTGSGKTEIYLRLARSVAARGRRVLILVPEIGLTPAAAGLFRARFGPRVAIQHSGLSAGERHDQWHRIRRGDVDIVVGTRSAVLAPLENVGLIVVDEEHDTSYKQDEAPRYNGRDVAVLRGTMERALVVLGTATPSLESAANAHSGRYGLLTLKRRILDRPMAAVRIVDMRQEYAERGADVTFSQTLLESIGARLERREQTVVLLNRRGFAAAMFCRNCGSSMECPNCSVTLTFHKAAKRLRCHYCNHSAPVPKHCPECGGEFLEPTGFGTERLEADLRAQFPSARVARVDRDTIQRRGAIAEVIRLVSAGQIDIVVGTQMIAKGHDFPSVTLVGVVSADVGLGLADFRAAERTFQLITQVVGRAGRGTTPGEAIVQSIYPEHYSIRAAAAQDYESFYEREMEYRSRLQYPPAVGLINVVVKGRSLESAMADAMDLAGRVRRAGAAGKVVGPAPAALSKVKNEYRAQFFLKSSKRRAMRQALEQALNARPDLKRRVIVDVDPLTVM